MDTPTPVKVVNFGAYTPAETIELISRIGVAKARMSPVKVFLSAVSGGCLLGFATAVALIVETAPWFHTNAPGLIRLVGGLIFPIGLVMVLLTEADLFTGTNMMTAVAALQRRISPLAMLWHWFLCFWGNLAGSVFVMLIIIGYGGVLDGDLYKAEVIAFVTERQVDPQFHQIFLRAIGSNWLACLAFFLAMKAKDVTSKVVSMWWPIFCFVVLGLDHVVVNMSVNSIGIWIGTPGLTVGLYIWKGIIPAGLGNIIGGSVFCGGYYWFMYLFHEPPVAVDGVYYIADSPAGDIEQGSTSGGEGSDIGLKA